VDDVVVSYPNIFELVEDLKNMGEGNAVIGRCVFTPFVACLELTVILVAIFFIGTPFWLHLLHTKVRFDFQRLRSGPERPANRSPKALHGHEDGTIPATFQVIFMVCAFASLLRARLTTL